MDSSDTATIPGFSASIDLKDGNGIKRLLGLARIAEASERYPDMCAFMKRLVEHKCKEQKTLEVEERNLLSVAYKNVVGSKRQSWRTLNQMITTSDITYNKELVTFYKKKVEEELQTICKEVIRLLGPDMDVNKSKGQDPLTYGENTLLNTLEKVKDETSPAETKTFYLKMVGDYCRYLAEIEDEEAKTYTQKYYQKAQDVAENDLEETHPTRLGLALNFSVCYYEIMKKPSEACRLAKEAFDNAIEKLDTLNDASYKDSTLIMQLLRDNLTLWTSESDANEDNP